MAQRSWLWEYRNELEFQSRLDGLLMEMPELIKEIKSNMPRSEILHVSLFGSYLWVKKPNDIDLFVVVKGTHSFRRENLPGSYYRFSLTINVEVVGDENLKLLFNGTLNEEIRLIQNRLMVLYGAARLFGKDLYLSESHLPIENFEIVEKELLLNAINRNVPGIPNNAQTAKAKWRQLEGEAIHKMLDQWKIKEKSDLFA